VGAHITLQGFAIESLLPYVGLRPKVGVVATGGEHCIIATKEGQVYTWGDGDLGKLGHGDEAARVRPTLVASLWPEYTIIQVAAGLNTSMCLAKDPAAPIGGSPFTFGSMIGMPSGYLVPTKVSDFFGYGKPRATAIACGCAMYMLIDRQGQLFTWGSGLSGQLGHGHTKGMASPSKVAIRKDQIWQAVAGYYSALAVTTEGLVFSWGLDGGLGCLGHGPAISEVWEPLLVADLEGVKIEEIAMSQKERQCFSLARSMQGVVFAWGGGIDSSAATGHGAEEGCVDRPLEVTKLSYLDKFG